MRCHCYILLNTHSHALETQRSLITRVPRFEDVGFCDHAQCVANVVEALQRLEQLDASIVV